jgi:hypothetical protein
MTMRACTFLSGVLGAADATEEKIFCLIFVSVSVAITIHMTPICLGERAATIYIWDIPDRGLQARPTAQAPRPLSSTSHARYANPVPNVQTRTIGGKQG